MRYTLNIVLNHCAVVTCSSKILNTGSQSDVIPCLYFHLITSQYISRSPVPFSIIELREPGNEARANADYTLQK